MPTISQLDGKRFDTDENYRVAAMSNIPHGWIYISLPDFVKLIDYTDLGDCYRLKLSNGETPLIKKTYGIYKVGTPTAKMSHS